MKGKSNVATVDRAPRHAAPPPPEKRCKHRTEKGTPCRAARRKESDYCIYHDKEFQERRKEAKAARIMLDRRKRPDSAEGIHALLVRNVEELREGKIEPRVANSIAYHAQVMRSNLGDLQLERSKLIPGHMEDRLQDLIVDSILDKHEKEIRKAGDNAYPVKVAERMADEAKERAPQDAPPASAPAPGTVPLPAPRVREIAPGVNEVIAPRGMPVSFGRPKTED